MDTSELLEVVRELRLDIEELEEQLEPLLTAALSATTKQLPVLDRAKLYVLVVYSIESLLYSYLRLNGVKAKEHPVYTELTRVKQYFAKITEAENGSMQPRQNMSLNKQAAGRIIKHALAGGDVKAYERELKEKIIAKRKLQSLEDAVKKRAKITDEEQPAAELSEGEIDESDFTSITPSHPQGEDFPTPEADENIQPVQRTDSLKRTHQEAGLLSWPPKDEKKQQKKQKKQKKKEAKQAAVQPG